MSWLELLKKQLTPQKLLFHFIFWGFHWGIFAYGWYVLAHLDFGCLQKLIGNAQAKAEER
jgi:hypothetical protein